MRGGGMKTGGSMLSKRQILALLAVLSILAMGCRSGEDADDPESDGDGETTTTQVSTDGETFGDLESPCGDGDASGATDQGVTDDAISIGTMADATATVQPGLNQELWDASQAFVEWCNAQGGINGRTIEWTKYESKLFEAQQATLDACDKEFMLVGGGAAFDNDVAATRVDCGLPDIPAFNATIEGTEAGLSYRPLATPFDELPSGEAFYLAEEYPDAVASAGTLAPNFASALNITTRGKIAYEAAGWNFIEEQLYNPAGEANWTGIVASYRSAGVDALLYTGTLEPLAAFLQAANEQDWKPTILIGSSTIFTQEFISGAGGAPAEGVYSYSNVLPFEEAEAGSATATYIALLDEYVDGAEPADLGADSMSAWLLWATAATACGSDLTRECIGDQISDIHEWTAGGLHAPSDPGADRSPSCFVLVQVQDGEWARVQPDEGYDCDPSYMVPTPGDYE